MNNVLLPSSSSVRLRKSLRFFLDLFIALAASKQAGGAINNGAAKVTVPIMAADDSFTQEKSWRFRSTRRTSGVTTSKRDVSWDIFNLRCSAGNRSRRCRSGDGGYNRRRLRPITPPRLRLLPTRSQSSEQFRFCSYEGDESCCVGEGKGERKRTIRGRSNNDVFALELELANGERRRHDHGIYRSGHSVIDERRWRLPSRRGCPTKPGNDCSGIRLSSSTDSLDASGERCRSKVPVGELSGTNAESRGVGGTNAQRGGPTIAGNRFGCSCDSRGYGRHREQRTGRKRPRGKENTSRAIPSRGRRVVGGRGSGTVVGGCRRAGAMALAVIVGTATADAHEHAHYGPSWEV